MGTKWHNLHLHRCVKPMCMMFVTLSWAARQRRYFAHSIGVVVKSSGALCVVEIFATRRIRCPGCLSDITQCT